MSAVESQILGLSDRQISRFTVPGAHAHWVGSTATPESWH